MTKLPEELYQPVDISWLATEVCDISPRRLQQIMQERGTPRAGHGKVRMVDGIRAFLRNAEISSARDVAKKWTDDPDLQQFLVSALIAYWRGFGPEIAAFAGWEDGPQPTLAGRPKRRQAGNQVADAFQVDPSHVQRLIAEGYIELDAEGPGRKSR